MSEARLKLNTPSNSFYDKEMKDVYTNIREDIERVYPYFAEAYRRARRNVKFVGGDQWNETEKSDLMRQFRIPYTWNKIAQQVNNILGTQINTKMDAKALPVEDGDQAAADVDNQLIKWAEQINKIDKVEQEVFKSGIVQTGYGVTQVRWQMSDFLDGMPVIERVPVYQMVWDLNATEIDLSDARWMARVIPMSRVAAMEAYPDYADRIETAAAQVSDIWGIMTNASLTPLQYFAEWNYSLNNRGRDLLYIIEHYERISTWKYVVVDGVQNSEPMVFDDESVAQKYLDALRQAYLDGDEFLVDADGNDRLLLVELKKDEIVQSLCIGNECVQTVSTDLPTFPYQVFFANFYDGEFWSLVDGLISPQRFLNRMISEWDNQMGRSNKAMMTVVQNWLPTGWTIDRVSQERSRTGAVIPVTRHDAIQVHPNQQVSPDFPNLVNLTQGFMTDVAGGQNILGLEENAAESSKTVKARQAAASLARLPLFSNLQSWRQSVTELVLWNMKQYLGEGQVVRIIGENLKVEKFLKLDTDTLDTIREARTDIVIESSVDSEIAREDTFNTWLQFFQTMQGAIPYEIMLPMLIKLSPGINGEEREEFLKMYQFYSDWQAQQQQAQQQAQIEANAQKAVQGEVERDQLRTKMKPEMSPTMASKLGT